MHEQNDGLPEFVNYLENREIEVDQPAHDLRRTCIASWNRRHRREDMDHLLQKQVGHVDGSMTSQYSLQGTDDVREVLESPMTRIGVAVAKWPV